MDENTNPSANLPVTEAVNAAAILDNPQEEPRFSPDEIREFIRTREENLRIPTTYHEEFYRPSFTQPPFLPPTPTVGNGLTVMGFPVPNNGIVDGFPIRDTSFHRSVMSDPQTHLFIVDRYFNGSDDEYEIDTSDYYFPSDHEDDYYDASDVMEQQPALMHPWRNPNGPKTMTFIAYVAAMWSIVCYLMVVGGNKTFCICPGSSILLQPNRFFVETITVEQESKSDLEPLLYGFNDQPPLQVITNWSEVHYASLQANAHKDWMYFLNDGSQINISYSGLSSRLLLAITRGRDGYEYDYGKYGDRSDSNTLSWNIIQGNGLIQQNIAKSGRYYIYVENLNLVMEEVELHISGKAFLYHTDEAQFMCMLRRGRCVFHVYILHKNYVVLTTQGLTQGTCTGREWHVKLTYGPRWITLFGGLVVIDGMIWIGIQLWKKYCCIYD